VGSHETWFHLIPGVRSLTAKLAELVGPGWKDGHAADPSMHHFVMGAFVIALLLYMGMRYKKHLSAAPDGGVIPETRFNARSLVEIICDTTLGMSAGVMGEKAAKDFLPLIGTMAFFILFANLLGLVPGFLAATDNLSVTAGCAVIIFFATHIYGTKVNGINHWKHLMGPVWWLAPLMLPIEIISHLARPLSLALRLMGNMTGDHKVLLLFLGLVPLIAPMPIIVLGMIVCVVQALVFCLLSVVYIGLAIEDHSHEEAAH
jgi:F-type H+-transporting ATPase subunit a